MNFDEEINHGLKVLGLDSEEKRKNVEKIIEIGKTKEESDLVFEFSTVKNLDWNKTPEEDTDA